MTPTRADLERLIENWRERVTKHKEREADDDLRFLTIAPARHNGAAKALTIAADELAALLTSEGPAPTEDLLPCIPSEPRPGADVARVKAALQMLRDLDMRPCDIDAIAPIERDALGELLDALNPADGPEAPTVGTWQPIETAPRDGTWFLACATAPGWGATRIVRFAHPDDRLPIHGEGNLWPSPPTHWMPLPDAPKEPTSSPPSN